MKGVDKMIINRTNMSIGCIPGAVEEAIDFLLQLYPYRLACGYNIILCDSFDDLEREWRKYYGYSESRTLPLHYDGQFLAPETKTEQLTILICLKETVIAGAEQYFKEKNSGREEPSEERGLRLLAFFHFVELLCHEFSHLCSYDRMMALTNWSDPMLPAHNHDYHLHDEFIARIRGTEVMLRMGASLMETDLIYSLYVGYVNDTKAQFMERTAEVRETVKKARQDLEAALPGMQFRENLTDDEMIEGLEYELGHKLQYGRVDGRIRLSDLEAMEFSAVDEMAEPMKGYIYALKNPYAVYEGTQFTGALVGFYNAFCPDETCWNMNLEQVISKPFWQYLDINIVKEQDEKFRQWLVSRAST